VVNVSGFNQKNKTEFKSPCCSVRAFVLNFFSNFLSSKCQQIKHNILSKAANATPPEGGFFTKKLIMYN
jgi:hypothetical protein